EALAALLAEGRASVINRYLRDEKALITTGSAGLQAFPDLGFFEVDLETDKPLEAQTAVLAELENIKKNGVTKEQLARAKTLIAQNHYHELETVDGLAYDQAYYEALGDWKRSLAYIPAIQKVSADDVVRVAKKYLTVENLSVFEYLPESVTRNLTREQYRTAVLDNVQSQIVQRSVQELPVVAEIPRTDEGIVQDLV